MDAIRIGLSLRALRIRRRLTQSDLAAMVGLSRSAIARIERGHADRATVRTIVRVASALGASVSIRILWHGEALDRLLDAAHADLTDLILRLMRDSGWELATEVSFNIRGERGVIDVLAFHPATGALLVIEVKSVVPDLQGMLGTLDRKVRIATDLARERRWRVTTVSRLLVFPDDRTARRRVERHTAIFAAALPARTPAVRRWLKRPVDTLAGIMFLTDTHHMSTRHRVGGQRRPPVRGGRGKEDKRSST
jgi:transcriptional regulator with XRE-family HTH domain